MPRTWRTLFIRAAGVNLTGSKYFIARDVQFDSMHPGNITILAIDDGGFTAIIFKRKVSEATTKDEIESIFVMHTEEYD